MEFLSTKTCQYLGLREDSTTLVGYPSTWNVCYHSKKHEIPNLNYQRSTCLGGRCRRCPLFNSEEEDWMPRSIRHRSKISLHSISDYKYPILIVSVIIIFGLIILFRQQWYPFISQALIPSWQKTQQVRRIQPSPTIQLIQTAVEVLDDQIQPSTTPTTTATISITKTVTINPTPPILAMDTPIGSEIQFIIHRTLAGESLFQFANQYDTNVDAIKAVNYALPPVLYVDLVVIIPIGVDDPAGLPQFEAYQVTMRGFTVNTLSEELSVRPQSLSKYNHLPMDYKFNPGEWILVPRE